MPHMSPVVSVVISTYNRRNLLPHAMNSVLSQGFRDFELIIIDDGSTDDTRQVVARFADARVRYVFQENAGLAAGRNAGIRHARGEYICFLDDDDLYLRDNLATQVAFLREHPEIDWCSGGSRTTDMQGQVLDELQPWRAFPDLGVRTWLFACPTCPSAVMVKKHWLERIGGFDTQYGATDDWDAWLRLAHAGCKMSWVEVMACDYRLHDSNMTRGAAKIRQKRFAMLDRFYSDPALSPELRELQQEVYARAHLEEALRQYGVGLTQDGAADMERALALIPELLTERQKEVVDLCAAWTMSPTIEDPFACIRTIFANLPPNAALLRSQYRRAISQTAMSRFFRAYETADWATVRRMFAIGIWNAPTWLRNRGVWSILFRSLVRADHA